MHYIRMHPYTMERKIIATFLTLRDGEAPRYGVLMLNEFTSDR